MRSILAFGLMIAVIASADAATMRHSRARHRPLVSPNVVSSSDAVAPGWGFGPSDDTDTPTYNDPSKSAAQRRYQSAVRWKLTGPSYSSSCRLRRNFWRGRGPRAEAAPRTRQAVFGLLCQLS